ncbi:protein rolling stone-like [Diadema antillarum]|uniref:protein rolling stone-like n=1 Tax=Diadema antillarum TaxID=105358 RepID=UPI003A839950
MSSRKGSCQCSRPKCSDFGLGGVPASVFVKAQCPMPSAVFLVYRLVVTLYLFGYFLYNFILSVRPGGPFGGYYFIYLTNWGFIILLAYLFCALWNLIVFMVCQRNDRNIDEDIPWYFFQRGQWFLFNIYATSSILISVLYWGAIHVPGAVGLYYDINFHLLNGLVALVEIFLTATVVRVLHFIYPFCLGVAFVAFSGIYWAAMGTDEEGNRYIYPILDYSDRAALASGAAVGACFAVILIHVLVVWGFHKLKLLLVSKLCPSCSPNVSADSDVGQEMAASNSSNNA